MTNPQHLFTWYPMPRLEKVEFKKPNHNYSDTVTGVSIGDQDQTWLTVYPEVDQNFGIVGGIELYGEFLIEMTNPVLGTFFEWDQDEFTSDEKVAAMLERLRIRINEAAERIAARS